MAEAKASKKTAPVTGRVTKQGLTQTLQKCVGKSPNNMGTRAIARQPVGVFRMQTRFGNQRKGRNPMKSG